MICDTGPLVATANSADKDHAACKELIKTQPLLVIPAPVLAEAGYLISK